MAMDMSDDESTDTEDFSPPPAQSVVWGSLDAPETEEDEDERMGNGKRVRIDGDEDADEDDPEETYNIMTPGQASAGPVTLSHKQLRTAAQGSLTSPSPVMPSTKDLLNSLFIQSYGQSRGDRRTEAGTGITGAAAARRSRERRPPASAEDDEDDDDDEDPLEEFLRGLTLGAHVEDDDEETRSRAESTQQDRRRVPTRPVIPPLSETWEERVREAMGRPASQTIASTSTGQTITRRDLGTLLPPRFDQEGMMVADGRPSPWLNDEIINAYMQAVVDYGQKRAHELRAVIPSGKSSSPSSTPTVPPPSSQQAASASMPRYHYFNTYFYPKIRDQGPSSVDRWLKRAKLDPRRLLEMERIFIPVHQGAHWTLLVISPRFRTIEYFDSLNGRPASFVRAVKRWLAYCLKDDWNEDEWKVPLTKSPVQENGYDCGVFTITTARMITLGIDPMAYNQTDIPLQRRRIAAELINGGLHGEFDPREVHD